MLIARDKKYSNIAEYILYMYQLEDIMRACNLDEKIIDERLVQKFEASPIVRSEISAWYRELIMAMKDQKIEQSGHLQYLKAQVEELSAFNLSILESGEDADYTETFKTALPALSDIVQKSNGTVNSEIDAAFTLLYGMMVIRMKGKEVSEGTQESAKFVSAFIRQLVKKFHDQGKTPKE